MKSLRFFFIIGFLLCVCTYNAHSYIITNDMVSPSGGIIHSENVEVTTHNMQPYTSLTQEDMDMLYQIAQSYLSEVGNYVDSLTFYNCYQPGSETPVCDERLKSLLLDPNADYESVGFVSEFQNGAEFKYSESIRILAFLSEKGYEVDVIPTLRSALQDMLIIYMIFGDEFLIDALDLRIPALLSNPVADEYLSDQIHQLEKAITYYRYGYDKFIQIWTTPVCCGDTIIGDLLTVDEWDIFTLLCKRFFMSTREMGTKQRILGQDIRDILSSYAQELYIQIAAISTTLGENFETYGGGQLLVELNQVKQEVSKINNDLNVLGYDERYVPLNDFDSLYGLAVNALNSCEGLENQVKAEERDFDYTVDKINEQQLSLKNSYTQQLAELTGCDPSLSEAEFIECVEISDFELYDCPIEMSPSEFESCVQSKTAGIGVLGAKYRQIKEADISLDQTILRFQNIGKRIENENARVNNAIQIIREYYGAQIQTLEEYRENMKDAVDITKTRAKVKNKTNGKKEKVSTTTKSFHIQNDSLKYEVRKEKKNLELTLEFNIQNALNNSTVKDLLLQEAEALISIDLAVQNKNTMVAAFDSTVRQKENLLVMWRQNEEFTDQYWIAKLPVHRLMKSNLVMLLSNRYNELKHLCYLTAKALEYKYMEEMENVSLAVLGEINLSDIYKFQTTLDFDAFLDKLNQYNVMEDLPGVFQPHAYGISLCRDILGFTDTDETVRTQRFQDFIAQNIDAEGNLHITFSTALNQSVFQSFFRTNLKIWDGAVPPSGSSYPSRQGLAISLWFDGWFGNIWPKINLMQKGTQSFYDPMAQLINYYPINSRALLNNAGDSAEEPVTIGLVKPFVQKDPRFDDLTYAKGSWTSAFHNRSIAATEWELILYKNSIESSFSDVPITELKDIVFYFDTIGYEY